MINFGFFNDVLHDLWAGNGLGWRTHQGGVGRGICSRINEGPRATRRFFIPISPRFEYYMNVVENFLILQTKKVLTLQVRRGSAKREGNESVSGNHDKDTNS